MSNGRNLGLDGVVFGGVIRDIIFNGPSAFPRDVDVVLADQSFPAFQREFYNFLVHKNRFGGLYLRMGYVDFDVWALSNTWAFKNLNIYEPSFENLPKTTFLTIDSIAVELWPKKGKARQIYECGFFESIENRTIDLNLPDNPFPALCVLRTLVLSRKLQFRVTDALAEYIVREFPKVGMTGLIEANQKHYDRPVISFDMLEKLFSRKYRGGADFNRCWAEMNDGFRRQSTFEDEPTWEVRERHSQETQLGFPGVLG